MQALLPPVDPGTPGAPAFDWDAPCCAPARRPTACSAAKVMWGYLDDFLRRRLRRPARAATDAASRPALRARHAAPTGSPRPSRCGSPSRRSTGATRATTTATHEPVYSYAAIAHLRRRSSTRHERGVGRAGSAGARRRSSSPTRTSPPTRRRRRCAQRAAPTLRHRRARRSLAEPTMRRQSGARSTRVGSSASATSRGERMSTLVDELVLTPPGGARGRGGLRDARGRGRVRAPRAAVQRRQGLDRAAAAGREGVPAGAASPSRSCTSTRATTSRRCSSSATAAWRELGEQLIVASVQDSIDAGRAAGGRRRRATGCRP